MQKMPKDRINPPYVYLLTIGKICPHFLSNTKKAFRESYFRESDLVAYGLVDIKGK